MSIETVAYIATAAAQEDALLCELLRAAAPLGVALHVAPDAASGFEFLARAVSPPTTVVLAPGPTQPSLAKRVHALVPSALIVCLNGCLQQIRSALSTHARHAVIETASPHLSKRLASALSRGDHEETVGIVDQAGVSISAPSNEEQAEGARIALDLIPAAVAYIDSGHYLRFASRQCQAWFPAASGTICGRHLREVLDENFYQRVEGCVEAALQGVEATCEVPLHRDGGVRLVCAMFLPDRDRAGHVRGVVCFVQDVTERRRLEQHLLQVQKRESVAMLAGGIAHGFNNLLTVILGNISLAALQAKDETRLHASLDEAQEAVERARRLTRELLTFARGPVPVAQSGPIVSLLRETAAATLQGSAVRAEFIVPDDPWSVEFDAKLLGEAFASLMLNAVQAMPLGGTLRVIVKNVWLPDEGGSKRRHAHVKVSIVDGGMGIPEEHLCRIFDPYFTTKQSGSGLGLATAYAVIQRHRGVIEVSSRVGTGTCVCVYLPITVAERREGRGRGGRNGSTPL